MSSEMGMTFAKAAAQVLDRAGKPLHAEEITNRALKLGLVETSGKTPSRTMHAILAVSVKNENEESPFVRVQPGTFGLRQWVSDGKLEVEPIVDSGRVRVPFFPRYEVARNALIAWSGLERAALTSMRSAIMELTGTPQANLDWSDPTQWMPERLSGEHLETARITWERSTHKVNPRHTTGNWYLATVYGLLVDGPDGRLVISKAGRDFIDNPNGGTVRAIDEAEGVLELLGIIAEVGPAARRDLLEPWTRFLQVSSRVRAQTTAQSYLWARLRNLHLRGMTKKVGVQWAVTNEGVNYLGAAGRSGKRRTSKLHDLIHAETQAARETLHGLLTEIDPIAFEYLIKDLLEAMSYTNVEVTAPGGDKGVDVIGEIELGITSVKEVVQVKRHEKNIQRHVLDALRGSLHRFHAVRGTIITTGGFARGTQEAAFERGAAPITLISGDKLIDLLIEHGIGVRKRRVELLEVDPDAFRAQEAEPD